MHVLNEKLGGARVAQGAAETSQVLHMLDSRKAEA